MIGYIEFEKHYKLGNLTLDFYKNPDEVYNTIILAGENGCGKTSVLEAISAFQNGVYLESFSPVKKVEYFDWDGIKRTILREMEANKFARTDNMCDEEWDNSSDYSEQIFYSDRHYLRENAPEDIRNRPVVYSEARSGFEVNLQGKHIHYEYESQKYEKEGADYSALVQLLIDLEKQDEAEFTRYAKFVQDCPYGEYMEKNSSIGRFKRAFNEMFEDLSYVGIDTRKNEQTVYFMKGDKQISINELSTGEKQIVFRGTDLLYNAAKYATVLIDEPELSLHPKWQKKILNFYRNLFKDDQGNQMAQIIIATHSEYVIQSIMDDTEDVKVVILKRDGSGIKADTMKEALLGKYVPSEINYLVFGVEMIEYHILLFGALHALLQAKTGSGVGKKLTTVDKYIRNHACYDPALHEKVDPYYKGYHTLPTYIRNAIDHPENPREYREKDLECSIQLLRDIYRAEKYI